MTAKKKLTPKKGTKTSDAAPGTGNDDDPGTSTSAGADATSAVPNDPGTSTSAGAGADATSAVSNDPGPSTSAGAGPGATASLPKDDSGPCTSGDGGDGNKSNTELAIEDCDKKIVEAEQFLLDNEVWCLFLA